MNIVYSAINAYFSKDQHEKLHQLESKSGVRFYAHIGKNTPLAISPGEIDYLIHTDLFKTHNLDEFKRLKCLQLFSAGTDRLDMDWMNAKKIMVKNASDVYSVPIAEFTVMRILEIYKSARYFEHIQNSKNTLKKRDLIELYGKTVAIYGYGSIGREIATRLKAFGVKTIGISRSGKSDGFLDEGLTLDASKGRMKEFDAVISCLPQTDATEHFFNATFFDAMKKDAIFINISRGGVVDEKSLVEAIKAGKFLGVALDVFETEPLSETSELWTLDTVYLSPHNTFASTIMYDRLFERVYQNLIQYIDGETV